MNLLDTLQSWPVTPRAHPDYVPERAAPMLVAVNLFTDDEHKLIIASEAKCALREASEERN